MTSIHFIFVLLFVFLHFCSTIGSSIILAQFLVFYVNVHRIKELFIITYVCHSSDSWPNQLHTYTQSPSTGSWCSSSCILWNSDFIIYSIGTLWSLHSKARLISKQQWNELKHFVRYWHKSPEANLLQKKCITRNTSRFLVLKL